MTQHNNSDAKMNADPTPDMAVENWLQDQERQGKSQHTLAAYRRGVAHFVQWNALTYGTPFDPAVIVPRDVRDWKTHQQVVEQTAPATTNQRLVALSRFFAWAVKQGIAHTNPTEDVGSIHLPQRQPKGLDRRDLRRLLRAVHASGNLRDIAVIEVLAATGLRVGELLALQIGDVELKERSGKLTVRRGKHGSYREVPLTTEARTALRNCLAHHSEADHPSAPLWLGTRGKLSHRSSIVRLLNKYAYQAGIEDFSPHALRHTFAARYLTANPDDARGLAALLGHANLNTVMIYTEPRLEDLVERMERVEVEDE